MTTSTPPFSLKHAVKPIDIFTKRHDRQFTHPDIIKFEKAFTGGLNNSYKYVMVATPYPYYDETLENPYVLVSNDGACFVEDAIPNPIEPYPGKDYHNSDPDFVYVKGFFHLFWRLRQISTNKGWIMVRKSQDLVNWGKKYMCSISPAPLSPAVLYDIYENRWKMWGVVEGEWRVAYYESVDGLDWEFVGYTNIPQHILWNSLKLNCWHLDVNKTRLGKKYLALLVYASGPGGRAPTYLFYGESDDGVDWVVYREPVLTPLPNSWQSSKIYRSTFIIEEGKIKVWYSAASSGSFLRRLNIKLLGRRIGFGRWGIGYTEASIDFVSRGETTLNVISE